MRRISMKLVALTAMAVMLLGFAGPSAAKLVPKVDNFILFVDHSGSMGTAYKGSRYVQMGGISKIALAKNLLLSMNQEIPELGYQGGLYTFAPYKEYAAMATYNRADMEPAINAITTEYNLMRRTPMGWGLEDVDKVIGGLSGKTAVIIFSDGASNRGVDPRVVARQMVDKYGDKICFHIVSYADTKYGEEVLKEIAAMSECSCMAIGEDLVAKENLVQFLMCSLYEDIEEDETVIFRSIYFDFDKSNIKPEFVPVLEEGLEIINAKPEATVVLGGHTDSVGTVPYNQGLSERRANSVKAFFVKRGVDPMRIEAVGYGELNPKYSNATAEGRRMNRRVDINFK